MSMYAWNYEEWLSHYGIHKFISLFGLCDLDLLPMTFKINMVHPPAMGKMSDKFR